MTTHEPTTYDDGPNATPRYRIDWGGKNPQPGDLVLMTTELFEQCVDILNRDTAGPIIGYRWNTNPEATLISPDEITIVRQQ